MFLGRLLGVDAFVISDFEHYAINAKYILKMEVNRETEQSINTMIIRAVHFIAIRIGKIPYWLILNEANCKKKQHFQIKNITCFCFEHLNRANQNNDAIYELTDVRNLYLKYYLLSSNTYILENYFDVFVDLLYLVHLKINCRMVFKTPQ